MISDWFTIAPAWRLPILLLLAVAVLSIIRVKFDLENLDAGKIETDKQRLGALFGVLVLFAFATVFLWQILRE